MENLSGHNARQVFHTQKGVVHSFAMYLCCKVPIIDVEALEARKGKVIYMSMEISSSYGSYYNNTIYHSKENEHVEKSKPAKVQGSKEKVEEYYQKLCKKFPEISFNTGGSEMPCSSGKVVVNLSYECLKKMANDPKFAKAIEYNLSGEVQANAMTYKWAKRDGVELGGRTVTYDAKGNRTSSCGGMRTANAGNSNVSKTQDKDDSLEERIRKKREEKEEMEARLDKNRRKRKEFQERLEEMRQEREMHLEYFIEGKSSLKQYHNMEITHTSRRADSCYNRHPQGS